MLQHKKESCEARFNTVCTEAEKRCRLDDGASASNTTTCVTCNINVPTRYFLAHQRPLQHKNKSCKPLSDSGIKKGLVKRNLKRHVSTEAEKRCKLDDDASASNTTTCVTCHISVHIGYFLAQ